MNSVAGTANNNETVNLTGNFSARPVAKKKVRNHPVLSKPILGAVLLTIHGFFFYQILVAFGQTEIASSAISVVSCVLLLLIHKLWFREEYEGSVSLVFAKERKYLIAIVLYLVLDLATGILSYMDHGFAWPTVTGMMMALAAGTVEEAVFRVLPVSVMMRSYKDKNYYLPALILPAVLFGCTHLVNVGSGQSLPMTILQVVSATVGGLFFGALYLRTGSIVPSMIIHVIHDMICSLQANQATGTAMGAVTTMDVVTDVLLMVVGILFTIWLLKGHKEEILETWRGVWHTEAQAEK